MLPLEHPDRIQVSFDDHRLVANAGLLLPVTLAQHLGLRELVDSHVDLGAAPGRANTGDKIVTLVASAPRFRGGRVWLAATALTTPTCCALGEQPVPWAARSRCHPPWGPSFRHRHHPVRWIRAKPSKECTRQPSAPYVQRLPPGTRSRTSICYGKVMPV